MSESKINRFCADCETPLKSDIQKCPKCGSGNKLVKIEDTLYVSSRLRGEIKTPDISGNVVQFKIRRKIAGESGNLTREELTINRRNKKETIKHHKVEEFIDGKWQVVHEHSDKFKAKRR